MHDFILLKSIFHLKFCVLALPLMVAAAQADTPMNAGVLMNDMTLDERFMYVAGIVEGLAYRRLEKDTLIAGEMDESGMACIYRWFYPGDGQTFQMIQLAFERYPERFPVTIVSVMIRQTCGE